jgi:hypothetical protein
MRDTQASKSASIFFFESAVFCDARASQSDRDGPYWYGPTANEPNGPIPTSTVTVHQAYGQALIFAIFFLRLWPGELRSRNPCVSGCIKFPLRMTISSARVPAAGEDDEDDLDAVDADENEEYEAFLEELYSPSD